MKNVFKDGFKMLWGGWGQKEDNPETVTMWAGKKKNLLPFVLGNILAYHANPYWQTTIIEWNKCLFRSSHGWYLAKSKYFTNLDFPEMWGPISLPDLPFGVWGRYNLASSHYRILEENLRHAGRFIVDEVDCRGGLFCKWRPAEVTINISLDIQ